MRWPTLKTVRGLAMIWSTERARKPPRVEIKRVLALSLRTTLVLKADESCPIRSEDVFEQGEHEDADSNGDGNEAHLKGSREEHPDIHRDLRPLRRQKQGPSLQQGSHERHGVAARIDVEGGMERPVGAPVVEGPPGDNHGRVREQARQTRREASPVVGEFPRRDVSESADRRFTAPKPQHECHESGDEMT